jgi:3-hydroxyisobutyrate dehydrogenase-like beta-hydroxyacid dehydrogenase
VRKASWPARRSRTLIDLSTTGPSVAKVVGAAAAERKIAWVDSPVSGGVMGATKGTLAVMVSCATPTFAEIDPLLKVFGKTFHVGEKPGLAQVAKLANNLLAAAALVVSSEAMAMGVKAGINRQNADRHNQCWQRPQQRHAGQVPEIDSCPARSTSGFATGLSYKDVRACAWTRPRRWACRWSPAPPSARCWR